ncbi:MAG TPA: hypothetical protein VHN74_09390 [Candidatus Angelobacter sp.]|nr:hypothetical protein [Candidatus Angelobacter sp.]
MPRKKKQSKQNPDRLIRELERSEERLQEWIDLSDDNLLLLREDPMAALRKAGLDMEDDIMLELEMIMTGIARKLK